MSEMAVPAERRTSPATESSSLTPTRRISPSISESCGCSLGLGSAERHCGSVSPVVGVDMGHGARPDDEEARSQARHRDWPPPGGDVLHTTQYPRIAR